MAYTSSPQFNTYKSIKVPFIGEANYRSGDLTIDRDLSVVNFMYDKTDKRSEPK